MAVAKGKDEMTAADDAAKAAPKRNRKAEALAKVDNLDLRRALQAAETKLLADCTVEELEAEIDRRDALGMDTRKAGVP